MKRVIPAISLAVLQLCLLGVCASAQNGQDWYKLSYFSNNGVSGAPDATVRIDNPGSSVEAVGAESGDVYLCAMIYVFDNDQQLTECCGCLITPDGLRTLSVSKDLTSNPLTGVVSNNGVIEMVSTLPNNEPCDPTTNWEPVVALRAWASHVQNKVGSAYPITETPFSGATLSEGEAHDNLIDQCFFAQRLGSGHGVCSCGTGD